MEKWNAILTFAMFLVVLAIRCAVYWAVLLMTIACFARMNDGELITEGWYIPVPFALAGVLAFLQAWRRVYRKAQAGDVKAQSTDQNQT